MELKPINIPENNTIRYDNLFDSKYEIGVRLQDFNVSFEQHYHNYIEIVCQLNSSSTQVIDGVDYQLLADEILIIHPEQSHKNLATESTVLNLIISEKFLTNLVIDSAFDDSVLHIKNVVANLKHTTPYKVSKLTKSILQDIYFLMLSQQETTMYYLRQKLNISSFFISLEEIEGIMTQNVSSNKWDLITYIESNIETATLNAFAKQCNYSPSLVSQKIKSQYGMSFVEILQELRLKHAARKLSSTSANIEQVMTDVGYNNKTHFYNLFKEKYGVTPSVYRKSHKQ